MFALWYPNLLRDLFKNFKVDMSDTLVCFYKAEKKGSLMKCTLFISNVSNCCLVEAINIIKRSYLKFSSHTVEVQVGFVRQSTDTVKG